MVLRKRLLRFDVLDLAHSSAFVLLTIFRLTPALFADAPKIETFAGNGEDGRGPARASALEFSISQPFGVEIDPRGSVYVTEVGNHRISSIDPKTRSSLVVVGTGNPGFGGDGGPAIEATLLEPYEVRFDAAGNMFFVEMKGSRIRRVDAKTSVIETIAGNGRHGYAGDDGPAKDAVFKRPHSIALDAAGNIYVADIGNHRIRRIDAKTRRIETIAGNGKRELPVDGTIATGRPMLGPRALHIVGDTMWIALREGHSVWTMDLPTKKLTHIAGIGKKGFEDGDAKKARFNGPKGIVASPDNAHAWIVDTENQCIRRIDVRDGKVHTVAGTGPKARGFGGDDGPATKSKMDRPHGITIDREGHVYVGDTNNHRVRRFRSPVVSKKVGSAKSLERARPWSQFLGPRRNGISEEVGLHLDWRRRQPKVLWRRPLGKGFSSISSDGERVFTMAAQKGREFAAAFDAESGKPLWHVPLGEIFRDFQGQGEGPRATPTVHDGKLYCLLAAGDLVCLDAKSGTEIWKKNVYETTGTKIPRGDSFFWGLSASPIVEGETLVVTPGAKSGASVAAFDLERGSLVWKTGSDPVGYGSPIAIDVSGARQIVATTGTSYLGLDPRSGRQLWRHEFGNKYHCNCATPVWHEGALFVSSSYGTGCASLAIESKGGGRFSVRARWKSGELQNHYATSIVLDGNAYGCHANQGSTLRCLDLRTGKKRWASRAAGKCSLIAAEGTLICLSERGVLTLVRADPRGCRIVGRAQALKGARKAWAPPALSNGRLYVRDHRQIVCLDLRPR